MNSQDVIDREAPSESPEPSGKPHVPRRLSLRTRWAIGCARYSPAGMLARLDERRAISLFAAVNGGLAILAIGFFSWVTDLPLMFPALGPTAYILFSEPRSNSAAPRSVILGHFSGMAAGWAVWHLVSALFAQPVSIQTGGLAPVVSATLALAVTCVLMIRLSCSHPPSCASSLIVALGGVTDWLGVLLMAVAVVWIAMQAVAINRFAGVPVPIWSPIVTTELDDTE